jgi:hypothetical protein
MILIDYKKSQKHNLNYLNLLYKEIQWDLQNILEKNIINNLKKFVMKKIDFINFLKILSILNIKKCFNQELGERILIKIMSLHNSTLQNHLVQLQCYT